VRVGKWRAFFSLDQPGSAVVIHVDTVAKLTEFCFRNVTVGETLSTGVPRQEIPALRRPSVLHPIRKRRMLLSVTNNSPMSKPTDLVQGTLDLLILKILALESIARLGVVAAPETNVQRRSASRTWFVVPRSS